MAPAKLSAAPPITPPPKLNTPGAADYVGVAEQTLETWRVRGGGPEFIKVGRKVWYLVRDLDAWMEKRRATTTAQCAN